jgi:hypothetical protein
MSPANHGVGNSLSGQLESLVEERGSTERANFEAEEDLGSSLRAELR